MAILTVNGVLNENTITGLTTVVAPNSGSWSDLSGETWDQWFRWQNDTATTLTWLTNIVDFGESREFVIEIDADIAGTATYYVYTSDTGAFAGEQTETTVAPGASGIQSFSGRFLMIGISVAYVPDAGAPEIRAFEFTANLNTISIYLNNQNTADLSGTTDAKTLPLGRTVSKVLNGQLTSTATGGEYVVTDYVLSGYFETEGIPVGAVTNKSSTTEITVAFYESGFTNSTFDCVVQALPEQYRSGPNLALR